MEYTSTGEPLHESLAKGNSYGYAQNDPTDRADSQGRASVAGATEIAAGVLALGNGLETIGTLLGGAGEVAASLGGGLGLFTGGVLAATGIFAGVALVGLAGYLIKDGLDS